MSILASAAGVPPRLADHGRGTGRDLGPVAEPTCATTPPRRATSRPTAWAGASSATRTLKQITPSNVKRLVPVWNLSLDNSANASSQPLVIDGVMYVASHTHTMAIDAADRPQSSGRPPIELPADINGYLCCGIHSRGLAALDGMLYRTTIDAHVVAHQHGRRQAGLEEQGRRLQGRLHA